MPTHLDSHLERLISDETHKEYSLREIPIKQVFVECRTSTGINVESCRGSIQQASAKIGLKTKTKWFFSNLRKHRTKLR